MSRIVLAFASHPTITPHEATGLALLLGAMGTPVALKVAAQLTDVTQTNHPRAILDIGGDEKVMLLAALDEVPADLLPDHLRVIRQELATSLAVPL